MHGPLTLSEQLEVLRVLVELLLVQGQLIAAAQGVRRLTEEEVGTMQDDWAQRATWLQTLTARLLAAEGAASALATRH